jgi:hypothetical protein
MHGVAEPSALSPHQRTRRVVPLRVRCAISDARIKLTPGSRTQLKQITSTLEHHRDVQRAAFAAQPRLWVGLAAPDQLAKLWQRMQFSADEVEEWLSAGCVMPVVAAAMRASHISSQQAAQPTDVGDGPPATIGFKCSTLKLSLSEAKNALGSGEPGGPCPVLDGP